MNKFLSVVLILTMVALLMISCNRANNSTDASTETNTNIITNTNDGTDSSSDTSTDTNTTQAPDIISPNESSPKLNVVSRRIEYYPTINLGKYLGEDAKISAKEDYPRAYSKIVSSYEEIVSLTENGKMVDISIFDTHKILIIEKTGTFYYNQIGYREFDNSYIAKQ